MRSWTTCLAVVILFALAAGVAHAQDGLQIIQQPTFWIVGQWTRIIVGTPADCGPLEVTSPEHVALVERLAATPGNQDQRFIFRAEAPFAAGEIVFTSGNYRLSLPVRVMSWEDALTEKYEIIRVMELWGLGPPERMVLPRIFPVDGEDEYKSDVSYVTREQLRAHRAEGSETGDLETMAAVYHAFPDLTMPRTYTEQCPLCGPTTWVVGYGDDGYRVFPGKYGAIYARTGDRRAGQLAAISLFRIAEEYLNLAWNINQRNWYIRLAREERNGIPEQGILSPAHSFLISAGANEEGYLQSYMPAFDYIWDYLQQDDPELVAFLQAHDHPEIRNIHDVRHFIEKGLFRTAAQACKDMAMLGNQPSDPKTAMALALLLNTDRSIELVDWAYNNRWCALRDFPTNHFFVDGSAFEAPGYNNGHYLGMEEIGDILTRILALRPEQYANAGFPLLTEDPKFKYMFDHAITDMSLISRTHAMCGDDGDLAYTDPLPLRIGSSLYTWTWIPAYKRWPEDVNYARAMWDDEAKAPIPQLTDPVLRAKVTEIVGREGPYADLPSQVLDGFGHVILRSGEGEDQRALWMRYGSMIVHSHHDSLTIGLEALRRTFLPEQGYNRGQEFRTEWDMNWALHYCARIVGVPGEEASEWGMQGVNEASLRQFGDGGWVKMATAGRNFYRDVEPPELTAITKDIAQERTIALVDLDAQHSYAVSIFRLDGGTDHYTSFHGPRGTAQSTGLQLAAQQGGTLAGPEVPYGTKWDSEWSKQNPHLMMFPFLYNVQRSRPSEPWQVTWDLEKYPAVHLRMHSVAPSTAEVDLAKGKPAGGASGAREDYELQWVVQHNSGPAPLATQFVEVIEAYEGQPLITQVRRLTVQTADTGAQRPVAFQVVAGNRVDTIIHSPNPDVPVTTSNGITMQGSFGIWSEENGAFTRAFLNDGTRLAKGDRAFTAPAREWTGTIRSVDVGKHTVVVSPAPAQPDTLVGRYVRITNALGNDVTHQIAAVQPVAGGVELTLKLDPRIGAGPVLETQEDGVKSAIIMPFSGGLYYRGKTLTNEDGSAVYDIAGVKDSRAYISKTAHPQVNKTVLNGQFVDKDGDGLIRFLIYDYGVGDTVTVPTVISSP